MHTNALSNTTGWGEALVKWLELTRWVCLLQPRWSSSSTFSATSTVIFSSSCDRWFKSASVLTVSASALAMACSCVLRSLFTLQRVGSREQLHSLVYSLSSASSSVVSSFNTSKA